MALFKFKDKTLKKAEKLAEQIVALKPTFEAMSDLRLYAGCKVCKHGDFKFTQEYIDCSYDNNNWQWRGVCPENTKED